MSRCKLGIKELMRKKVEDSHKCAHCTKLSETGNFCGVKKMVDLLKGASSSSECTDS